MHTTYQLLQNIAQLLFDKKARNIIGLDLRGVSNVADYFLIAEGTVDRHTKALERAIEERLTELGLNLLHIEGERTGDWIVMDYGDFMIHLFIPELRERYGLEQLWCAAHVVTLHIDTLS